MENGRKLQLEEISKAIPHQQEMCECFAGTDWDLYKKDEIKELTKKISLLISSEKESNPSTEEYIQKLSAVIIKEGTHECDLEDYKNTGTFMNFIFVYIREDDASDDNCEIPLQCFPVFRVPKDSSSWNPLFIDLECRVYQSWDDFLKNNQFPPCVYCYPEDGKYAFDSENKVKVCFDFSPSSSLSTKLLRVADTASTGISLGCTIVGVAAALSLPVAAPLLAASCIGGMGASIYGAVRSATSLKDRSNHNQSISLSDPEARNCWIATAGCAVGAAATGATAGMVRMARAGSTLGKGVTTTVNALNGAALAFGGAGVVNGAMHLWNKYEDGKLTPMDGALFSANLFLFFHATVRYQTAQSIVDNTQNKTIQDFKDTMRSNKHRKAFSRLEKNTYSKLGPNQGRAQVIRTINNIKNVDDFMAGVVQTDKQVRYTRSKGVLHDGGKVLYNSKVSMDPTQMAKATAKQRVAILRASQRFSSARLSEARFNAITREFFTNLPPESINVNSHQTRLPFNIRNFTNPYGRRQPVDYDLCNLVHMLNTMQKRELENIFARIPEIFHEDILKIAHLLWLDMEFGTGCKFICMANFVSSLFNYLIYLVFEAVRRNIVGILQDCIPDMEMQGTSRMNCCIAILKHICENYHLLIEIYFRILDFTNLIVEMCNFPFCIRERTDIHVQDFLPPLNIILSTDEVTHKFIVEFGKECLGILGFRKFATLVNIIQELLYYLQEVTKEMKTIKAELTMSMFDDEEIRHSILNRLQENISEADE